MWFSWEAYHSCLFWKRGKFPINLDAGAHSHILSVKLLVICSNIANTFCIFKKKYLWYKNISTSCQKSTTIIHCSQYDRYSARHKLVSLLFLQVPSSAYLITDKDHDNSFTPVHYAAMSGQAKVNKWRIFLWHSSNKLVVSFTLCAWGYRMAELTSFKHYYKGIIHTLCKWHWFKVSRYIFFPGP